MTWLCKELEEIANRGHMLELTEVWKRYCTLIENTSQDIPPSFISRRSSFKDKLNCLVGEVFEFHATEQYADSGKRTVLVPKQFACIPIDQTV